MSSVVQITFGSTDITANVLFESTTFTAKVNGQLGECSLHVRDIDHSFVPTTGQRIVLTIDGDVKWSGFGMRITKAYMFPAQGTDPVADVVRIWVIDGIDDNVLFDKRIVFDVANPAPHGAFQWAPGSWDDDIIHDIFANYLDLSDDNIVDTGVVRVSEAIFDIPGVTAYRGTTKTLADWESTAYTGTIAAAGYTWGQAMDTIQRQTSAMYYIDGVSDPTQRILCYVDVETVTSDYALTDTPAIPVPGGGSSGEVTFDDFNRTVAPEGAGTATPAGFPWTVGGTSSQTHVSVDGSYLVFAFDGSTGGTPLITMHQTGPWADASWEMHSRFLVPAVIPVTNDYIIDYQIEGYADLQMSMGADNIVSSFAGDAAFTWEAGETYDFLWSVTWNGPESVTLWKTSDPQPETPLFSTSFNDSGIPPEPSTFTISAQRFSGGVSDNVRLDFIAFVIEDGGGGVLPPVGYREFSIVENGSHLTNDMHVWGNALGSKLTVHAHAENADSIALHNRWVDGYYSDGLYHQVAADTVAASYVNGTPQGHRGRKDDQVSFQCRTLQPVFRVGQVVTTVNSQFDFNAPLPLREMRVSFFAPDTPIFDLSLGHEIDQPWSFYEAMRKMPRPWEIGRFRWQFPALPRFVYCPDPVDFGDAPAGLLSIFQQSFGGVDYDSANPPLIQPFPLSGAHWRDIVGVPTPYSLTDTIASGFMGPDTIELNTPSTGALEVLMAFTFFTTDTAMNYDLSGLSILTGGISFTDVLAGFSIQAVNAASGAETGVDALRVTVTGLATAVYSPGFEESSIQTLSIQKHVDLPLRYIRQPLWIRVLLRPSDSTTGGRYIKIWPRSRPEPVEWTVKLLDSEIPLGVDGFFDTTGPHYDVVSSIGLVKTNSFGPDFEGYEAISVYSQTDGDIPLFWGIKTPDANSISATWGTIDDPSNGYTFFWPAGIGAGYFASSKFTTSSGLPTHTLNWAWPQFDWTWEPTNSQLYLSEVNQTLVSFRMGAGVPYEFPTIGFDQRTPTTVTISGEFYIQDDSGGLWTGAAFGSTFVGWNLPFPVTVSFNEYDYGPDDPFFYPYEALPAHRNYVFYDAVGQDPDTKYWVPFEFTTFPLASDTLQWGVSFVEATDDFQQLFRNGLNYSYPGRLLLPNTASTSIVFRKLVYKANYTTGVAGEYFCVEGTLGPNDGSVTEYPAFDSGDHQTYLTGSAFVSGSTTVYVNGLPVRLGSTEDYTEIPSAGAIVFNSPLNVDDEVVADFEGIGPAWGLP